jgi:predicted DCC family thiol-disulfide oxidoreductase YuxK
MKDKKVALYYDGSCPMCTVFAETVTSSPHGQTLEREDITKGSLPDGATFDDVWKEMYVVENGIQYKGADAVLRILREFPRWRWLAAVGSWSVFNTIAHGVYRIVAANRHRIPWRRG